MKVAILTDSNPRVKYSWMGSSWSGLHYYLSENLEKNGVELVYLGPVYLTRILVGIVKVINKKFFYKYFKKNIDVRHTAFIAKIYAYVFEKKIKERKSRFNILSFFLNGVGVSGNRYTYHLLF